jgi:hypothetical protein
MGSSQPIQEGTQVRERQEIVTIPNAGGMLATVSLHESVLKQVRVGQRCEIKVDALSNSVFHGDVQFVAVLPDQNSWWANPNTRLYTTTVQIRDASSEMRPGMSCSIEILVEDIADALYVPVQSVFRHEGKNICFVDSASGIEPVPVEVGRFNDRWVEIKSGVQEGQIVLLAVPPGFNLLGAPSGAGEEKSEGAAEVPPGAAGAAMTPPGAPGDAPALPTAGAPNGERNLGGPEGMRNGDGSGRFPGGNRRGRRGDGAQSEREGGFSRDGEASAPRPESGHDSTDGSSRGEAGGSPGDATKGSSEASKGTGDASKDAKPAGDPTPPKGQ